MMLSDWFFQMLTIRLIRKFSPLLLLPGFLTAQTAIRIDPAEGRMGWLTRPYQPRSVPAINLADSPRLESLMRAGNLYLSSQDVIALAIENNLDVEVQRYGPLLAREVLRRAQAGGALRSVGAAVSPGPLSVSLQGVSINSNGLGGAAGGGVGSGGGIVTQLGPAILPLDPNISFFANFQHATSPQSNTILTGTTSLIQNTRTAQAQYQQNWSFGLSAQVTYFSQYTKLNSQFFDVNPFTVGDLDLQVTQNLLQGFGSAVNGRNIRVQKNNLKVTDLQFKQQVITTISAVLNLYWDLVSFDQDLKARQRELVAAQDLLENNKKQVAAGSLAELEITRAEAQVYASQQDLLISQTNLLQQETVLKNALSRNGVASPFLSAVRVIPLDRIAAPGPDQLKSAEELIQDALRNRVEVEQSRINVDSNKLNLVGIKSSLKPTLQAFAELTNNGLTGGLTALGATVPGTTYLSGGYGNVLAQIFRRNYPNYSAGVSLNIPLRNRAAQSDYVTSELELRQNELTLQKNINQVRVDVQNAVIGLQQARARFDAAAKARVLQEQILDGDQKKFAVGYTTAYQIVQDQRDLASSESAEVQALANFSHAKIALDQALGNTLEMNHISLEEAASGHVARLSVLPASLPEGARP
jgi:outer membrane protein